MTGVHSSAPARTFPPVAELVTVSLGLVVVGGIVMAASFPSPPSVAIPVVLLAVSVAFLVTGLTLMARQLDFAWATFRLVGRWALLAYVISGGMIEFAFVRNHATGAPLLVVSLMLVVFALDVPVIIAFTVARYQQTHPA
ncbi:MAG: hypothetical protein M3R48_03870 [Candidatus Dormibacteraeota bacterium]|nr:hypothetical protein [Candidatus Dormibacteraeota bacterium]